MKSKHIDLEIKQRVNQSIYSSNSNLIMVIEL